MISRREVLAATATLPFARPAGAQGSAPQAPAPQGSAPDWDAGPLAHLLPGVSADQILIKASFHQAPAAAPELLVGTTRIQGRQGDSAGLFWQFRATGLRPGTAHRLTLQDGQGRPLAEPWDLSTFPAPDQAVPRLRLLFYSCGGGHDLFGEQHSGFDSSPSRCAGGCCAAACPFSPTR